MNRHFAPDLLKAIAAIGVVYIHGAIIFGTTSIFQKSIEYLFKFAVPCFLIIWAYFYEISYSKRKGKERIKYTISKFKHLLYIYLIWGTIYFFLTVDWNTITSIKIITKHFLGYGWSGQYFLLILFQLFILFPILRILYEYKIIKLIILIFTILLYVVWSYFYGYIPSFITKIGDKLFIFWIPYIFLAISLARNKLKKIDLFYSLFVILIPLEFYLIKNIDSGFESRITLSVFLASTLLSIAIFKNNLDFIPIKLKSQITLIAKNSFPIYLINPLVILILESIIPKKIFPDTIIFEIVLPLFATFLITFICIKIGILIKKLKLEGILI